MNRYSLCELLCGESAVIHELSGLSVMRRRLLDMGFTENTVVKCIGESPCGGMRSYLVKGAVVALRDEDCENIYIYRRKENERDK